MIIRVNGQEYTAKYERRPNDPKWNGRDSVSLTLEMSYAEAIDVFVDDAIWTRVEQQTTYDDEGKATVDMIETDMSAYAMAGPVTDNRDGTVTVKMGKPLPTEIIGITLTEAPKTRSEAAVWRSTIETAVQSITDDAVALASAPLYPEWAAVLGKSVGTGFRFRYGGSLYKVLQPHMLRSTWIPGEGTESLYTRIDEAHSGTESDPIPYEGNMALMAGLHYKQGGKVYRCTRDTVSPVYHALADLVGVYVEAVA